jgi:hypothetical protein
LDRGIALPEVETGGQPQILSGTLATRPAFGVADRYYWATDIYTMFRDTGIAWEVVGQRSFSRYIQTLWSKGFETAQALNTNNIYYSPIEIPYTLTIDRLGLTHGGVAAGQFYMAIYDSLNEAPVNRIGVSASTVCAGINQKEQVPLTIGNLQLTPGCYFLAVESNNNTDTFLAYNADWWRFPANVNHGPSWYQENLGGYIVPPAVAIPVFVDLYERMFIMWVRVASIP